MKRREFFVFPLALALAPEVAAEERAGVDYQTVIPGRPLQFPRDHGSHADYRTEWWYITGWVEGVGLPGAGIQVTFFRSRPGVAESGASRFAPSQLLFAHAAISDPGFGRLRHDQRVARAGFGLAGAAETTTDVHIGDWSLRLADERYRARIDAREFAFDLTFAATQPILPQGSQGFSRKGPRPAQASHYYSRPHLAVTGALTIARREYAVRGSAWLDHEWSSEYLGPDAIGWDWTGVNLDDGRAFMAFRIRDKDGGVRWAGGTLRERDGTARNFSPDEIRFTALRQWRSPRTGIEYPVAFRVQAGDFDVAIEPVQDDQELDSRSSVGAIYWEGAVRALAGDRAIGRGYLELTGYGGRALRI